MNRSEKPKCCAMNGYIFILAWHSVIVTDSLKTCNNICFFFRILFSRKLKAESDGMNVFHRLQPNATIFLFLYFSCILSKFCNEIYNILILNSYYWNVMFQSGRARCGLKYLRRIRCNMTFHNAKFRDCQMGFILFL